MKSRYDIPSGQTARYIKSQVECSRLDMTEKEINIEIFECLEKDMTMDEIIEHLNWLIDDHNDWD